jgi:hypothetical protein
MEQEPVQRQVVVFRPEELERLELISHGGTYQQWLAKKHRNLRRKRFYSDHHARIFVEDNGGNIYGTDALTNAEFFWSIVVLYSLNPAMFEDPLAETRYLAAIVLNAYKQQYLRMPVYAPVPENKENDRDEKQRINDELATRYFIDNVSNLFITEIKALQGDTVREKLLDLVRQLTVTKNKPNTDNLTEALKSYKEELANLGIDDCYNEATNAILSEVSAAIPSRKGSDPDIFMREYSSEDDFF